jgi:hypothetical protein
MSAAEPGPQRETSKERWSRIPLDYYKHPDHLERWKTRCAIAALVLVLAWLAAGFFWDSERSRLGSGGLGRLRASHGPLARVHAAWESNCEACHVAGEPIQDNVLAPAWPRATSASEKRCQSCHQGPAHHTCARGTPSCASCHRDHRGRDASLARTPDSACTQCHADLKSHIKPGAECARVSGEYALFSNIRRFDVDHPEFRTFQNDPGAGDRGKLAFNHALHMRKGMALQAGGKPIFVLGMIADAAERKRYALRAEKDSDPVQLDCTSCHQTEGGAFGRAEVPSAGEYMQPITYEVHCRACHELRVDSADTGITGAQPIRIPHGLQPAELHQAMREAYVAVLLETRPPATETPPSLRSKPPIRPEAKEADARQFVSERVLEKEKSLYLEQRLLDAEKTLFLGKQTCGECHVFDTASGTVSIDMLGSGRAPTFRVVPTNVAPLWFRHARFNHRAHHAISCRECHPAAYAEPPGGTSVTPSMQSSDVLVPRIETCRQCHAPASRNGGGAAFDCTECHRYHGGDRPLHGPGGRARDPSTRLTIEQFLSGARQADGREN